MFALISKYKMKEGLQRFEDILETIYHEISP